jgi:hypothetical protein
MNARPGAKIPLTVTVSGAAVRSWVVGLSSRFDREVTDARVVLRELRPKVVEERNGFELKREKTVAAIVAALRRTNAGRWKPLQRRRRRDPCHVLRLGGRYPAESGTALLREKLARVFTVATASPPTRHRLARSALSRCP